MVLRLVLASILILSQVPAIAQIEKLQTTDEIVRFVDKVAPGDGSISSKFGFRLTTHSASDSMVKAYHLRSFEKVDLDGNGLTDLIFNGSRVNHSQSGSYAHPVSFAILDFGNDSFCVRDLKLDHFGDIAAHPIFLDDKTYIQTIRVTQNRTDTGFHAKYHIDTLVWAFNTFIERKRPVKRKITQVDYNSFNGLLFQENMTLRIIDDSVRLTKEMFTRADGQVCGGVFLSRLDPGTRHRLYGLLDAIDFASLKEVYNIDASDASVGTIKITYDNGQTKIIADFGTCGTYGLAEIHQLLYGLTESQRWVKADRVSSRCIDSLHSDGEVLGLVRTLDMDYPFLEFEPDTAVYAVHDYRQRLSEFGQQRWQTADIDGNGYTDLLFNGYLNKDGESTQYAVVVLSFGNDSLCKQDISGENDFIATRIIRCNGHDALQINHLAAIADSTEKKGYHLAARQDTLTAYDGQLAELPPTALHHIETLRVHYHIDNDSMVVIHDTIYWYKNDAAPPDLQGDSVVSHKDSINLYTIADSNVCQKVLKLAGGIRFERVDPGLLLSTQCMRHFSTTWYFDYDGGKQSQFVFAGGIGSYRLTALESHLWDLKHNRTDWKFVSRIP